MGYDGRITSVVSVRRRRDLAYLDVQERLQALHRNYTYIPLPTEEAVSPHGPGAIREFVLEGGLEKEIGEAPDPGKMSFFLCGSNALIGVPGIDRQTRRKVYPKDPASGRPGLIEILEARYGFMMDPAAKSSAERGSIHYEKWY
ncbi:MAG: hypothetical protein QF593_09615 [Nitrospinota bacterium]|nr:hypothetical protein [Nitrospinota bacterium]